MGVVIEQSGSSPYLGARCENIFIHNIDPGTIKNMITYFGSQQRNANEIFILDGVRRWRKNDDNQPGMICGNDNSK